MDPSARTRRGDGRYVEQVSVSKAVPVVQHDGLDPPLSFVGGRQLSPASLQTSSRGLLWSRNHSWKEATVPNCAPRASFGCPA